MSCDMPPARRWLLLFTALAHLSTAAAFSTSFLNLTPKVHGGSLAAPSTCSKLVPRLRSRDAAARGEVRMGAELLAGVMGKSVLFGGALAGGLHAAKPRPESPRSPALAPACEARRVLTGHSPGGAQVSGPDHFPALLPRCMGKPWFPAAKIGSLWGSLPTPAPLSRTPWLAPARTWRLGRWRNMPRAERSQYTAMPLEGPSRGIIPKEHFALLTLFLAEARRSSAAVVQIRARALRHGDGARLLPRQGQGSAHKQVATRPSRPAPPGSMCLPQLSVAAIGESGMWRTWCSALMWRSACRSSSSDSSR